MQNRPFSAPPRLRIKDSLGREQSLNTGAAAFEMWPGPSKARRLLVLGLGPYTATEAPYIDDITEQYTEILWLECPEFAQALGPHSAQATHLAQAPHPALPPHWRRLNSANAFAEIGHCDVRHCDVRIYRQNLRLFPEFWGPLWGEVQRQSLQLPLFTKVAPTVLVLSDEKGLLTRELTEAFAESGFTVKSLNADAQQKSAAQGHWRQLLRAQRPALVFSVNGQGLDAEGELFHLLQACQVPVALWFVDNPWHILSRFRLPWWRGAQLFCTDAAFVDDLRRAGAARTAHLPLAVAPHMWQAQPYTSPCSADIPHGPLEKILFVGRLAFPQRQAFFGAARVPNKILSEALALVEQGANPHSQWWAHKLGLTPQQLWPGHAARAAGLGAEECALRKRLLWLQAASQCGLSHYGHQQTDDETLQSAAGFDKQFCALSPKAHPPVDYYGALPRLYATASYTLNVTSLLLPHGLTQRHFDVWAAGGFLLTDTNPGLDIFPAHLVDEICLARPQNLAQSLHRLDIDSAHRRHLQEAWKEHLRAKHCYKHRIATICEHMQIRF